MEGAGTEVAAAAAAAAEAAGATVAAAQSTAATATVSAAAEAAEDGTAAARVSVSWYDESGIDSGPGPDSISSSNYSPRTTISSKEGPHTETPCCLHLHRLALLQQQAENKPTTNTLGALTFLSSGVPAAPSDAATAAGEPAVEGGAAEAAPDAEGEAAAAAAAAQSSLWSQSVTPLRSLMETMLAGGPLGAPRTQSAATHTTCRSRTSSIMNAKEAYQGKTLGVRRNALSV